MARKFQKYWSVIANHILIAHVLDPRYKMEHLRETLIDVGGYTENEAEQFISDIHQKIILFWAKYASLPLSPLDIEIDDNIAHTTLFPKRRVSKRRRVDTIDHELELYEREPLGEFKNNDSDMKNNGILYWNSLSNRFPILSRMARNYLAIQPSSVASERAFSQAGLIVTNDRANLSEKTVTCMILMHSWLKESQK